MVDVQDYDDLCNLIVQYGQDYFDDYADERLAFEAFLDRDHPERTEGALRELNEVDRDYATEDTLEAALDEAGLAIIMSDGPTPYRDFVGRLRTWLTEALQDDTPVSPDTA